MRHRAAARGLAQPKFFFLRLRIINNVIMVTTQRSSYTIINGHVLYPNDVDRSLNEDAPDKIRQCRSDYNNRPSNSISFCQLVSTSGDYIVNLCVFYFTSSSETDHFFAASGVQLA